MRDWSPHSLTVAAAHAEGLAADKVALLEPRIDESLIDLPPEEATRFAAGTIWERMAWWPRTAATSA